MLPLRTMVERCRPRTRALTRCFRHRNDGGPPNSSRSIAAGILQYETPITRITGLGVRRAPAAQSQIGTALIDVAIRHAETLGCHGGRAERRRSAARRPRLSITAKGFVANSLHSTHRKIAPSLTGARVMHSENLLPLRNAAGRPRPCRE